MTTSLEEAIARAEAQVAAEEAAAAAEASSEASATAGSSDLAAAIARAEAQVAAAEEAAAEEEAATAGSSDLDASIARAEALAASIARAEAQVAAAEKEDGTRTQPWGDSVMARGDALLDGLLFGWGNEASAFGRTTVGMALEGLDPRMEMEDFGTKFDRERGRGLTAGEIERENFPGTMAGLEIAGSIPSIFKAGQLVGNAPTRLGNVGRQAGMGGGEMLSRELGKGEGDLGERAADIDPLQVAIGVAAGGAGGSLMKGQNAIDNPAPSARNADGTVTEEAFQNESNVRAALRHTTDDLYTTVRDEVGFTEARMLSGADADSNIARQQLLTEERLPHKAQDLLIKAFDNDPGAAKLVSDAGAVVDGTTLSPAARVQMLDAAQQRLAKSSPEAAEAFGRMRNEMDMMQAEMREIFPNIDFEEGYMPITMKEGRKKLEVKPGNGAAASGAAIERTTGVLSEKQVAAILNDPVTSFMSRWEDTVDALALAKRFDVTVDTKSLEGIHSFSDAVIMQIQKEYTEKLGKKGAQRLANNLRLFAIQGNQGMGPVMSLLRTTTSAALLGTPENAMLQLGDVGVAAYETSFLSAIKALPLSIKSMFLTNGDNIVVEGYEKGLRAADIGISRQYFGEMFNKSGGFAGAEWLNKSAQWLQKGADVIMQGVGVTKANRFGQEFLLNSSLKQMQAMPLDKLKTSKYVEGLNEAQVLELHKGLQSGDPRNPAVLEAAFFAFARTQPGMRTALPPKYLQMKNGRIIYNMKQFMVKIGRKIDTDVIDPYMKSVKLGMNTKAGQAEFRKASLNAARYSGYIVALNALVDPGRKELTRGKESELSFGEQAVRQGVSFASKGLVDLEHGANAESTVPPALNLPFEMLELGIKAVGEDDLTEDDYNRLGRYLMGYRQILWAEEVVEN